MFSSRLRLDPGRYPRESVRTQSSVLILCTFLQNTSTPIAIAANCTWSLSMDKKSTGRSKNARFIYNG